MPPWAAELQIGHSLACVVAATCGSCLSCCADVSLALAVSIVLTALSCKVKIDGPVILCPVSRTKPSLEDHDMLTRLKLLALLSTLSIATGIAGFALAHSNGHESRTPAQCERLPGTEKEGERAQCLACVKRPKPHHYHPDYPAGERCRPDNGKP